MIAPEFLAPTPPVRVDVRALVAKVCMVLDSSGEKGLVTDMQHLGLHLHVTALRFYKGAVSSVDEFLQLYSLDEYRPKMGGMDSDGRDGLGKPAILDTPAARPDTKPITIPAGL